MERTLISLLRFWNGNQPLEKAFWLLFLPIIVLTKVSLELAKGTIVSTPGLLPLVTIIVFLIYIYAYVSLWRCAPNVTNPASKVFTYLARAVVVYACLTSALTAFIFVADALSY